MVSAQFKEADPTLWLRGDGHQKRRGVRVRGNEIDARDVHLRRWILPRHLKKPGWLSFFLCRAFLGLHPRHDQIASGFVRLFSPVRQMLTDNNWNFIGLPAVVVDHISTNLRPVRYAKVGDGGVQEMQTMARSFHCDSCNHIGI